MTDLRLTPQEIKAAIDNADYSSVIDGGVLRPNIQQDIDLIKARAIQSALLAKLSGMKLEDLRETVSKALGASQPVQNAFNSRLNAVMSVVSPFLAAKIEEARKEGEQAGMRKFYTFLRTHSWKWVNDDGKHIEIGLMTEELQNFLKDNGLEAREEMNIKVLRTGKVHRADHPEVLVEKPYAYWMVCSIGVVYGDATPTTDPVTCKSCLRILGKKK